MRSPLRRILVASLSLAAASALPAALHSQQGAIAGIVRDSATLSPLSGVEVTLLDAAEATVAQTVTDARGAFRFPDLSPGTYTLDLSLPGWNSLRAPGQVVGPGRALSVSLTLAERSFNLNPITVSTSKTEQKVLDAPAAVEVLEKTEIEENPALSVYDHVKGMTGVDIFKAGLQQGYAVARGFNNVFSGSMLSLTDNRIARVPSLRANVLYLNPTTNPDLDRVEVVLGPASALYGPNANNGVLHMLTKSPIDDPGAILSVAGGSRSSGGSPGTGEVFHAEGRLAAVTHSRKFGAKISGQYFRGDDWVFIDPAEQQGKQLAQACLADPASPACTAFPPGALLDRVGNRDFDLERWAIDFRADARPSPESSNIFQAGRTEAVNTIELTGIGAAQAKNWSYTYLQERANYKNFFGQVFWNFSDAGDTFLLATGQPIVDKSWVLAGQLQNATSAGSRQRFVYGVDLIRTTPRTRGTINGVNEDDDNITEVGGYLQSESRLTDKLDLVLAARLDHHSVIDEVVFSPRAGLVFKPAEGHSVRATFNRSFATPTTNNLFLDIGVRTIPLGGPFQYGVRAQGNTSFTFRRTSGRPDMRSPFAVLLGQSPTAFLPTTTPQLWALAVGLISAQNPQAGALLQQLPAPTEQQVGIGLRVLDATRGEFVADPRSLEGIEDISGVEEEIANTFEVGYKGVVKNRLLLAANVWFESRNDFIGPLRVETPNVFLDGPQLVGYLMGFGVDQQTATALAIGTESAPGIARIPLGVISPEQATGDGANLMLTYRNFGDVDLGGGEFSARVLMTDEWRFDVDFAVTSDDEFNQKDGPAIALNAPSFKAGAGLGYRSSRTGLNGSVRYRFVNGFPVNSGVFVGEVEDYNLVDLTLGYRIPGLRGVAFQVDVENLFDDSYSPFVGTPQIGRMALFRVVYDLSKF